MHKLVPFVALLLLLVGCKKEEEDNTPKSFTDKIVLKETHMSSDSVALTWSQLDNANLPEYRLVRREVATDPGQVLTPYGTYPYPVRFTSTRFTDKNVPYLPNVEYQVVGVLSSGQTISSNVISYTRSDIKTISVQPFDVQFDKQRRMLYFFEKNGAITQYSLTSSQITKSISTAATIGYCDFATYNGVRELYVPRNDGWVFVYNAETLDKIDQVNVGSGASSVVAQNGLLYVSTTIWNRPLEVYSRATKTLVSETGDWYSTRLRHIPGSNTELLEITLTIGPTDQHYYSFSPTGFVAQHFADRYHGDYPLDANVFAFAPNGSKYVTSTEGTVYSKNLVYEATLPKGNLAFTSFAYDAAGQSIFGGTRSKTVEVYNTTTYMHMRTVKTKAHPFRLFEDGNNGILCVSSTESVYPYAYPQTINGNAKLVVEQIR